MHSSQKICKDSKTCPVSDTLVLQKPQRKSTQEFRASFQNDVPHIFVILGASGDLAKNTIYPNIWWLYLANLLPRDISIFGFARSSLTVEDLRNLCHPNMKMERKDDKAYEEFWKRNYYISGTYQREDFNRLNEKMNSVCSCGTRIFYVALPPCVLKEATELIKHCCFTNKGCNRIIIEKPFGRDAASAEELLTHLTTLFKEEEIYRIDHYLGKEMVQNLVALRFGNCIFNSTWNRSYVASVLISFKESNGCCGRAGYFDQYGIVRDVMQNHLLQILCLVAMERPVLMCAEDIRNEKVKVMRSISPPTLNDVVIGQYVAASKGNSALGYLDEPGVAKNSTTETYAVAVFRICNERWDGVPFILRCGKGLNENKAEIRIQYQDVPGDIFEGESKRNEMIIRVQPDEAVYIKLMNKIPGMSFDLHETELDLTYKSRYKNALVPDAYERLLVDVICGCQMHFVCSEEVSQAWRIFTPLLDEIEEKNVQPILYEFGSRGPKEGDDLCSKNNFKYYGTYKWAEPSSD